MSVLPKLALVVEDDAATAELEARALRRMGMTVDTAGTIEEAMLALSLHSFSVILLDHKLPDGASWPVLDTAQNARIRIPVIMVTGMGDERVAAEAIHRGAADYVVKAGNFWEKLPLIVTLAIKQFEKDRAKTHQAALVEFSPDAIVGMTCDGTIQAWNAAATRMLGCSAEEAIGANLSMLSATGMAIDFPQVLEHLNRLEIIRNLETVRVEPDGWTIALSLTIARVKDERGEWIGLSLFVQDLTERNARRNAEQARNAKREFLANI